LERRKSTCLIRFSRSVFGSISSIAVVALQVAATPHAPRLRPRLGLISALLAT